MRLFSVIGVSASGKTTTIEQIIKELRQRGYSVGSVKEIHFQEFAIDSPGSNTDRHRLAGSQLVSARGFYETDILYQRQLSMDEILLHYDYDFVALEGVSDIAVANIIAAHQPCEVRERRNALTLAVAGRLADSLEELDGLPCYSALAGPRAVAALVDLIEERAGEYRPSRCYTIDGQALSPRQNLLLSQALGGLQGKAELAEAGPEEGRQ